MHGVFGSLSASTVPAVQLEHIKAPQGAYVPAEQLTQSVAGSLSVSAFPAGQKRQIFDPAPAYCPTAHALQLGWAALS